MATAKPPHFCSTNQNPFLVLNLYPPFLTRYKQKYFTHSLLKYSINQDGVDGEEEEDDLIITAPKVKKAYRKLSLSFHPDKNKASSAKERFNGIANAYELLTSHFKLRFGAASGGSDSDRKDYEIAINEFNEHDCLSYYNNYIINTPFTNEPALNSLLSPYCITQECIDQTKLNSSILFTLFSIFAVGWFLGGFKGFARSIRGHRSASRGVLDDLRSQQIHARAQSLKILEEKRVVELVVEKEGEEKAEETVISPDTATIVTPIPKLERTHVTLLPYLYKIRKLALLAATNSSKHPPSMPKSLTMLNKILQNLASPPNGLSNEKYFNINLDKLKSAGLYSMDVYDVLVIVGFFHSSSDKLDAVDSDSGGNGSSERLKLKYPLQPVSERLIKAALSAFDNRDHFTMERLPLIPTLRNRTSFTSTSTPNEEDDDNGGGLMKDKVSFILKTGILNLFNIDSESLSVLSTEITNELNSTASICKLHPPHPLPKSITLKITDCNWLDMTGLHVLLSNPLIRLRITSLTLLRIQTPTTCALTFASTTEKEERIDVLEECIKLKKLSVRCTSLNAMPRVGSEVDVESVCDNDISGVVRC